MSESSLRYKCPYCGSFEPIHRVDCATQRNGPVNIMQTTLPEEPKSEADPHGKAQNEPGAKLDAGKIRAWLCLAGFSRSLKAVADVTTFGARKYTPNGWAHVPDAQERYMDAFGRHLFELGKGERIDPDSKCMHKAQMIWNLLASLELELRAEDERKA